MTDKFTSRPFFSYTGKGLKEALTACTCIVCWGCTLVEDWINKIQKNTHC